MWLNLMTLQEPELTPLSATLLASRLPDELPLQRYKDEAFLAHNLILLCILVDNLDFKNLESENGKQKLRFPYNLPPLPAIERKVNLHGFWLQIITTQPTKQTTDNILEA